MTDDPVNQLIVQAVAEHRKVRPTATKFELMMELVCRVIGHTVLDEEGCVSDEELYVRVPLCFGQLLSDFPDIQPVNRFTAAVSFAEGVTHVQGKGETLQ